MVKNILQMGCSILEEKTSRVDNVEDGAVQEIIQNLLDTCAQKKDEAAGLAAPQIGYSKAICVCRRIDLEGDRKEKIDKGILWEVLVNPKIIKSSNVETTEWEACLSIGKDENTRIYGPVSRPKHISVEYLDREGEKKTLDATGYFSHVVQHELDHLDGVLFLKYVKNPEVNLWRGRDLSKYLKVKNSYPPII